MNQILFDSTEYEYNDKNQLLQTTEYLFFAANSNDLSITDYEYNTQDLNTISGTNEFKEGKLEEGFK